MGDPTTYSGIATKVKATERQRIKGGQLLGMAALETVTDTVRYLRALLSHREILGQVEDKDLHRENIEQHLNLSQHRNLAKFHQLANMEQRRFPDLYFMYYEITILKTCLRDATGHRGQRRDLPTFRDFLGRHSALDLITLPQSQSMEEFIKNLKGPVHYEPLYQMLQNSGVTLPVCKAVLGILHFRSVWKIKDKYLSRNEQRIIAKRFDAGMDTLSPQRTYRSKRFYQLEPGEVYAMLIPVQLHLTRKEISRAVEAEDLDILYGLIRASQYGRTGLVHLDENQDLDHPTHGIIDRIYQRVSRKGPYSIAILNSYLYFKEREAERIITVIGKIHHGLGTS